MFKEIHKLTHRVAVNSYLLQDNHFLLLKRTNPPLMWGPPGGKLNINEDPIEGLKREVREETNLTIEVITPVTTWFGSFNKSQILSIDYLCYYRSGEIKLSEEHYMSKWLTIEDLVQNEKEYLAATSGFKLFDFKLAWQIYSTISKSH